PWTIRDSETRFSRAGLTFMYEYTRYSGNPGFGLISALSGNILASAGGTTNSFVVGPTWRTDLYLLRMLRVSPNLTVGAVFDWTVMKERLPTGDPIPNLGQVPVPNTVVNTLNNGLKTRTIDEFRYTDFGFGYYFKFGLDFP